jgi:hypothetical protein
LPFSLVEVIREIEVIKHVPVIQEVIKEVEVIRTITVPQEIIKEVEILKEIPVVKTVEIPKPYEVIRHVPIVKTLEVEKPVVQRVPVVTVHSTTREIPLPNLPIPSLPQLSFPAFGQSAVGSLFGQSSADGSAQSDAYSYVDDSYTDSSASSVTNDVSSGPYPAANY